MLLLFALGIVGGALSTVAGLGGGVFILVAISLFRGMHEALALTTPALLISNIHRAVLYRRDIDARFAKAFALGAVPGALGGGAVLPGIPGWFLDVVLAAMTVVALARAAHLFTWQPSGRFIAPAGLGIGALTATSGGAGILVSPLLLSAGL